MPITQRGKSWQVSVTKDGRRIRKTFRKLDEAQVFELECKAALISGGPLPVEAKNHRSGVPATFGGMAEHIWKLEWSKQKAANATYSVMRLTCSYFGDDTEISSIDSYAIDQFKLYLERQGNKPATVNRKLAIVSKVFRYAHRYGLIERKLELTKQREPRGRIKYYSREEEQEMLERMDDPDLRDFFIVLIDTGMRRGEVLSLEWEDVDLEQRTLTLADPERIKSSITRLVPATVRVTAVLKSRLEQGEIRPFDFTGPQMDYAAACFKKCCPSEQDVSAIFHTCRHTFISRLVQNGVPIVAVKELAGHNDIRTTMRYSHLAPSNLVDAIATLENPNG
tara:strand:+ start:4529 stop:5539 length:1011 start_codon:yes stop_codon:yes gene_type:complete